MRFTVLSIALSLAAGQPALAQTAPPTSPSAVPCIRQDVALAGGIGRASVVAFTGAVYGQRVCVLVANLASDGFAAAITASPTDDAVVTAAVMKGTGASIAARPSGLTLGAADPAGAATADANPVGPFVIAPGGSFPGFGKDTTEVPRVVLAYAGQRVLLVRTTAVTLSDLAHALREQPAIFGSDAAERAVILASGDDAAMQVRTADGTLGTPVRTPLTLLIKQR
jgi:hypothetical protein